MAMKELRFYYDIVCPFAYIASTRIESLSARTSSKLIWKPVLLGGIYKETAAPQGAGGSATDVMSQPKQLILSQDFVRLKNRFNVETDSSLMGLPNQKTLQAMRLLSATPNSVLCAKLTHALYKAYWMEGADVESVQVLQKIVDEVEWSVNVSTVLTSEDVKAALHANTQEAVSKGAFGVPSPISSLLADDKLFFGVDRMFLAERHLGNKDAHPPRLAITPGSSRRLRFYFDYSSPYSYLGALRLAQIRHLYPTVEVQYVPILLGVVLQSMGTPGPPALRWPEAKRQYFMRDLYDWAEYYGEEFKWYSAFPLNSLLPSRVTIATGMNFKLIKALFCAVWRDNKNISEESVMFEILQEIGLDGEGLIHTAKHNTEVKEVLRSNTESAIKSGLCGVPTFQVDDGPLIWGQDRLNVVEDMLCGWPDVPHKQSKL